MRLLIALLVVTASIFALIPAASASSDECRYVRVNRPGGQPPIVVWVCP